MARPLYQTRATQDAEAAVAKAFEAAWKCEAVRQAATSEIDYLLRRGNEKKAWMEVKTRTHAFGTYETYTIATKKWVAGVSFALCFKVPFIIAVQFTDGIYWTDAANYDRSSPPRITKGGRFDRNDDQDTEWMTHLPLATFRRLKQ